MFQTRKISIKNKEEKDIYSKRSLFLFTPSCCFWRILIWIVNSRIFEIAITILIFINSIFLGFMDYTDTKANVWRNNIVTYSEPFFTSVFTLESIFKIIAFGLIFGKNTYLKDPWNWIDFLVVITSLISLSPIIGNVSVIWTFRLIWPLKSIKRMPSMKLLINTLLNSIRSLGEVFAFAFFFYVVFSILGISLWSGLDYNWCY